MAQIKENRVEFGADAAEIERVCTASCSKAAAYRLAEPAPRSGSGARSLPNALTVGWPGRQRNSEKFPRGSVTSAIVVAAVALIVIYVVDGDVDVVDGDRVPAAIGAEKKT